MRTIRVGRLAGFPIGIQPWWFAIVGLLAWSLGAGYFPEEAPGLSTGAAYALGLFAVLLLFASVLLHELGHAVVARRHGVDIQEVDLWILGGVARMKSEPQQARDELRFAAAGPAVTAVIALFFGAFRLTMGDGTPDSVRALIDYQLYVNAAILVLNLLPAFPLDGGRIARAIMWARTGDHDRATIAAASAGRAFGLGLVAMGVVFLGAGAPAGLWFAVIGIFLWSAAGAETQRSVFQARLAGQTVGSLMASPVVSIPEDLTAEQALSGYFLHHLYSAFPAVDEDGAMTGLLTIDAVRRLPEHLRRSTRVGELADPDPALRVLPDMPLAELVASAPFLRHGRAVVVDAFGRPSALLSITDLNRWMRAANLLPGHRPGPPATPVAHGH